MKKTKRAIAAISLAALMITPSLMVSASDNITVSEELTDQNGNTYDYALTCTKEFDSTDKNDYKFDFEDEIEVDGVKYKLENIDYSAVDGYSVKYADVEVRESFTVSEVIKRNESEKYVPEKTLTENDLEYEITNIEYTESEQTESVYCSCYEETEVTTSDFDAFNLPDKQSYYDEDTDETFELPYVRYEEVDEGWHDGYILKGTVIDYGAPTYIVGDIELTHDDELIDVSKYGYDRLIKSLGADPEIYRAKSISYVGEPYMLDGKLCRDYEINCDIYGLRYKAIYEDEIDIPMLEAVTTYELTNDSLEYISELKSCSVVKANAFYKKVKEKSGMSEVQKAIITSAVVIAAIVLVALLLYLVKGGRKNTDYKSKRDIKRDYKEL